MSATYAFQKESTKRTARARLTGINASFKDLGEVCRAVRYKGTDDAIEFLEGAAEGVNAIPMRRHGTGRVAKVALISDAADTRSVDVYGLVGTTPTVETVVLNGAAEVLSSATFTDVNALLTTVSGSRTVTVKEGASGTTRGTIGIGTVNCFRWMTAASKSVGLWLPALLAGATDGIWEKVVWAAAAVAGVQDLPLATETL